MKHRTPKPAHANARKTTARKAPTSRAPTAQGNAPKRTITPALAARHLKRLRAVCLAMPESSERPSHGEPTFFAGKRVFAMFSNDHHADGHLAVILPVEPGLQQMMITDDPERFYYPAYVGAACWVGVELATISDKHLRELVHAAWRLVAPRRAVKAWDQTLTE